MSWAGQAPVKRARTGEGVPYFQDPEEELSHVASLVGKRRLQNRISQRNYRENRARACEADLSDRIDQGARSGIDWKLWRHCLASKEKVKPLPPSSPHPNRQERAGTPPPMELLRRIVVHPPTLPRLDKLLRLLLPLLCSHQNS